MTMPILKQPRDLVWDDRLGEDDKAFVAKLNDSASRLGGLRAVEITVSGPLAESKIAWKLVSHQHSLLHRIVALIDGAAVAWNHRCTLSAMLSARALMETLAVLSELERCVTQHLQTEDLSALDALAVRGTFATRDKEWLKQHPESEAINAITFVQKFDKVAPGSWGHYEMLSERCHPNAQGHNFMFSQLDRTDGTVRFTDERNPDHNGELVLAALAVFPLAEGIMKRLDALILSVANLQHRLSPVDNS